MGITFPLHSFNHINPVIYPSIFRRGNPTLFWTGFSQLCRSLNPTRSPILQDPLKQIHIDYEEFVFPSRDGWMLSGWFKTPLNGATVILTHGMGGNFLVSIHIAAMLIEKGFGILMYEMRSHGRSSGNLGTWGWLEVNDLNDAADY